MRGSCRSPLRANVRLIKSILKREGLTQRELAHRLGYTESGISRILAGQRQPTERFFYGLLSLWPDLHWSDLFFCEERQVHLPNTLASKEEVDHDDD